MPVALNGSTSGSVTITAPAVAGTNTLTLPAVTDTLVGLAATQTLTGKTLTSPTITGAVVSSMGSSVLTSATAQASTSGTSINFTDIPSWVKRITVMLNGVSGSGTSNFLVQIGSGSFTTSGYTTGASLGTTFVSSAAGFIFSASVGAANAANGSLILTLINSNTWTGMSSIGVTGATGAQVGGGVSPSLGGTLDRVRITTVNGTDTFDAGSINIMYE